MGIMLIISMTLMIIKISLVAGSAAGPNRLSQPVLSDEITINISYHHEDSYPKSIEYAQCDLLITQRAVQYSEITYSDICAVSHFSEIDYAFDKCLAVATGLMQHNPQEVEGNMMLWFIISLGQSIVRLPDPVQDQLLDELQLTAMQPNVSEFLSTAAQHYYRHHDFMAIPKDIEDEVISAVMNLWYNTFSLLFDWKSAEMEPKLQGPLVKMFHKDILVLSPNAEAFKSALLSLHPASESDDEVPDILHRIIKESRKLIEIKAVLDIIGLINEWKEHYPLGGAVCVHVQHRVRGIGLFRRMLRTIGKVKVHFGDDAIPYRQITQKQVFSI